MLDECVIHNLFNIYDYNVYTRRYTMNTRKKYERICEKIEQLNAEAFELEQQMLYEQQND